MEYGELTTVVYLHLIEMSKSQPKPHFTYHIWRHSQTLLHIKVEPLLVPCTHCFRIHSCHDYANPLSLILKKKYHSPYSNGTLQNISARIAFPQHGSLKLSWGQETDSQAHGARSHRIWTVCVMPTNHCRCSTCRSSSGAVNSFAELGSSSNKG